MKVEIKFKLKTKVDGKVKEITLDKDEAKELFDSLNELFGKGNTTWIYPWWISSGTCVEYPTNKPWEPFPNTITVGDTTLVTEVTHVL